MDTKEGLHATRFYLNMRRVNGLVTLAVGTGSVTLAATEAESARIRADLFRSTVVFLHATFEDSLRTVTRQRLRGLKSSYGSSTDVDKALRKMGLDTTPFKPLYDDLDRMMKRRHRIVHEADLPSTQDTALSPWTLGDYSQLLLWNLAVLAFYSLLRVSVDPADELQSWYFERRTKAIELARQTGEEAIALLGQPAESMLLGLQVVNQKLTQVAAHLGRPSHEELLEIAKKMQAK